MKRLIEVEIEGRYTKDHRKIKVSVDEKQILEFLKELIKSVQKASVESMFGE